MTRNGETMIDLYYMTHEGGKRRGMVFGSITNKDACFYVRGSGAYLFKLSNGECKDAKNWFIETETLAYVRQRARDEGVKFQYAKRVPLRDKVTKPRKRRMPNVDPRQGGLFYE